MENNAKKNYSTLEQFKIALETRNFELELFWKRSAFFWAFIVSAFAGFAALKKDSPGYAFAAACFGLVCSFIWTLANRGSKYWYEVWENKIQKIEEETDPKLTFDIFKEEDVSQSSWLDGRRFSVSRLAIGLSDFTCLLWCVVIFLELKRDFSDCPIVCDLFSHLKLILALACLGYMTCIFFKTKNY